MQPNSEIYTHFHPDTIPEGHILGKYANLLQVIFDAACVLKLNLRGLNEVDQSFGVTREQLENPNSNLTWVIGAHYESATHDIFVPELTVGFTKDGKPLLTLRNHEVVGQVEYEIGTVTFVLDGANTGLEYTTFDRVDEETAFMIEAIEQLEYVVGSRTFTSNVAVDVFHSPEP